MRKEKRKKKKNLKQSKFFFDPNGNNPTKYTYKKTVTEMNLDALNYLKDEFIKLQFTLDSKVFSFFSFYQ